MEKRRRVRGPVSLAACLAFAAGPAPAGEPSLSEAIEVRVVDVEAFVSDRRGRPVEGLAREDFEVLVDGAPVEIVNFYAAAPPAGAGEAAGTPTAAELDAPLALAVLVDNTHVDAHARNEALQKVRELLRTRLAADGRGPPIRVLLATAHRSAFTPLLELTDRLDAIERGFDEIAAAAAQDRRSAELLEILQDIGTSLAATTASVQGRMRSLEARIRAFSAEAVRDTALAAAHLRRLVSRLAGLPGRKAVLYLGGGLSTRPGEALSDALAQALGRYATLLPEGTPVPDLPARSPEDASGELLALARFASIRGVTLYAVALGDPAPSAAAGLLRGSVEAGAGAAPEQEESWAPGVGFSRRLDLSSSLELLAGETGGLAADGRGLGRLLDRLLADRRAFYSLGIRPPEDDGGAAADDGGSPVHRLEVRVQGRGRQVRHRQTFRASSRDELAAARTLTALWAEDGENPLAVRLAAGDPRPAGDGLYTVPISVQVPVAALAIEPRGDAHAGQVSIFVVTGSGGLADGPVTKATFPLTLQNAEILDAMGRTADYRLELEMRRGPGRIAVGVRDDVEERWSTQTLELVVGDAGGGAR